MRGATTAMGSGNGRRRLHGRSRRARLAHQGPQKDGAQQIERRQADEERGVPDAGHERPDEEREDQDSSVAAGASHAGDGGDLVALEKVRRHRDDGDGQRLMREAGQAEERDGHVGTVDETDERHARPSGRPRQ